LVSNTKYKTVNTGNISTSDNKIAVIYCVGEIGMGQGDDQSMGSERSRAEAISKARKDKSYKAIVSENQFARRKRSSRAILFGEKWF
jgi:ClpP class serine protease